MFEISSQETPSDPKILGSSLFESTVSRYRLTILAVKNINLFWESEYIQVPRKNKRLRRLISASHLFCSIKLFLHMDVKERPGFNRGRVLLEMVGLIGLEPMTPALSRRCSNQLSYRPAGMVEVTGFEPMTFCLQSRRSTN